jgi:transcriptional regulator with XRE-family HTH domain
LGEGVRKRRLDLGLSQRELAAELGVTEDTVRNWESGRTVSPPVRYVPALIRLLGSDPHPSAGTPGEQILALRRRLGLTQRALARLAGVDPRTVARWEAGRREPAADWVKRVAEYYKATDSADDLPWR